MTLIPIADKYDCSALIKKCKAAMSSELKALCEEYHRKPGSILDQPHTVSRLLEIVETAEKFRCKEIVKEGIKHIACFSSKTYSKKWDDETSISDKIQNKTTADSIIHDQKRCCDIFHGLPKEIQLEIYYERLERYEYQNDRFLCEIVTRSLQPIY